MVGSAWAKRDSSTRIVGGRPGRGPGTPRGRGAAGAHASGRGQPEAEAATRSPPAVSRETLPHPHLPRLQQSLDVRRRMHRADRRRSRAVPAGTDGGRITATTIPLSRRPSAGAIARRPSPTTQGMMCPHPEASSHPLTPPAAQPPRPLPAPGAEACRSGYADPPALPGWRPGLGPVENTNRRARFHGQRVRSWQPTTNAPLAPKAFPIVPTGTSAVTPAAAQRPLGPPAPSHPERVRLVDVSPHELRRRPHAGAGDQGCRPMLKYDSVTTQDRRDADPDWSARATASTSRWGTTTTRARERRAPSMRDAWFSSSRR